MPLLFNIESPQNYSKIQFGSIKLEGWIFSTEGNEVSIFAKIERKTFIPKQHMQRFDVVKAYPSLSETVVVDSGFSDIIYIDDWKNTKKNTVILRIYAKCGETTSLLESFLLYMDDMQNILIDNVCRTSVYLRNCLAHKNRPHSAEEWKQALTNIKNILRYGNKSVLKLEHGVDPTLVPYDVWTKKNFCTGRRRSRLVKEINKEEVHPIISIIMPAYNSKEYYLNAAIESVKNQIYENWELIVVDDCSVNNVAENCVRHHAVSDKRIQYFRTEKNEHISGASNYGVSKSHGEFIVLMDHDDLLTEDALVEVVKAVNHNPELDLIYSDDDKINDDGVLFAPQFKPDYSPELLLSYMYMGHLIAVRRDVFYKAGCFRKGYEGSQDYDLVLRVSEITEDIYHIPKVLYHWRATEGSTAISADYKPYSIEAGRKAVEDAVNRRGIQANVRQAVFAKKNNLGIYSLHYSGDTGDLVSIIIPDRDHYDLLKNCITSIEEKTTYSNYEIIVVDDHSTEDNCIKYLEEIAVSNKVIHMEEEDGKFNFSKLVNRGVEAAEGKYIILLNNDTEVITENWIENMLLYMKTDGVGAVGAKLLYEDGKIQHAGIVLRMGNGIAGHAFKLIQDGDGGYLSFANVARNYSAVTGACLMTSKDYYQKVKGFDEELFSVSYNDVDFCLKLINKGLRVVFCADSKLYHYEGASRGVEQTGHFSDSKEEYHFYRKWITSRNMQDPYYNINLQYENEKFEIDPVNSVPHQYSPLKILMITHNLNCEGAPLVQFQAAVMLKKKGYRISVWSSEDGLLSEDYKNAGIPVSVININSLRNELPYEDFVNRLYEIATENEINRYDLIFANTVENFWAVGLGWEMHLPTVWGIHESIDYSTYFSKLGVKYQKAFVRSFMMATKVVFVSNATRQMYKKLDLFNTMIIQNGVDLRKINAISERLSRDEIRKEMNLTQEQFTVSVVGSVCERKGQLVFAKAAAILSKMYPEEPFVFQIIGAKPSPYLESIKEYIENNDLTDKFRIIPYAHHSEMGKYYLSSDLFVCSSFQESSPLVLMEAMAYKLPIVSTNVFGIPELLRDRQDALLVPENNEEEMARAIRTMYIDPHCRNTLAENAWYRLNTFFNQDYMCEQYEYMFQSVYNEGMNMVYRENFSNKRKKG